MRLWLLLVLVFSPAAAAAPASPLVPPPTPLSADECAVWQRELGFARSLAEHDATAFAEHLHPQAAFGVSQPAPTRGRETITREWSGLIEGKQVKLSWYPTRVTIAGAADVAYSTGPALFERLDPKTVPRYSLSRFQSVWHRGSDGVWRVLFDDGIPPRPATEAEVAAFREGRREACPGV